MCVCDEMSCHLSRDRGGRRVGSNDSSSSIVVFYFGGK